MARSLGVAFAALLLAEIAITLKDFLVEDATRRLPPFERVLHAVLAIGYGAVLALLAPTLIGWAALPSALVATSHGAISWDPDACRARRRRLVGARLDSRREPCPRRGAYLDGDRRGDGAGYRRHRLHRPAADRGAAGAAAAGDRPDA